MVSLMGSVVDYIGSKISSNLTWYSFAVSYSKEEITFQWSSIFTEDKKNEEEDRQRKEERSSSSSSPTPKRLSSDAITLAPLDDGITYPIVREVWPSSDCSSALKNQRGTYTFLFIRTLITYQCCLRYAYLFDGHWPIMILKHFEVCKMFDNPLIGQESGYRLLVAIIGITRLI